jgi:hypothetical protein
MAATNTEQAWAVYSFAAVSSPFLKTVPQPVLAMAANFFDFAGSGEIGTMAAPAPYSMEHAGVLSMVQQGAHVSARKVPVGFVVSSACGIVVCCAPCCVLHAIRINDPRATPVCLLLCFFVSLSDLNEFVFTLWVFVLGNAESRVRHLFRMCACPGRRP